MSLTAVIDLTQVIITTTTTTAAAATATATTTTISSSTSYRHTGHSPSELVYSIAKKLCTEGVK